MTETVLDSFSTTASQLSERQYVQSVDASGLYLLSRSSAKFWLKSTITKIRNLQYLKRDWNSYGSQSIDMRSISNATQLVVELATVIGIGAPTVSATPSGSVALMWVWKDGYRELDVLVLSTGSFQYCFSDELDPSRDKEGVTQYPEQIAVMLTTA